jgi:hypothetical protein
VRKENAMKVKTNVRAGAVDSFLQIGGIKGE